MKHIGHYQIEQVIGRGAMGVVYRALDTTIGRPAAIKVMRPAELVDPGEQAALRQRLMREAQSAGMLSHPGIVTIYQAGEEGDLAYIAMELVEGSTLDELLSRQEALDRPQLLRILRQAAAALDYAHENGIVHRDVKPANLLIRRDGTCKVADFGVAKVAGALGLTRTGSTVGTPYYMSPEQVQGQALDGRSDQFSLAVIAYQAIIGARPFEADSATSLFYQIVCAEPAALQEPESGVRTELARVFGKALAKDPAGRYPSCMAFVDALEEACGEKQGARPPAVAPSRRKHVMALVSLAGVVAAGAIFYFASGGRRVTVPQSEGLVQPPPSRSVAPSPTKNPELKARQSQRGHEGTQAAETNPAAAAEAAEAPETPKEAPLAAPAPPEPQWATFRGNLQRNGVIALLGPARQPRIVWVAELGGQLRSSPVIAADGTVYVGSTDRNLYAIRQGQVVWSCPTGVLIQSTPAIEASGSIRVSGKVGEYQYVDKAGRLDTNRKGSAISCDDCAQSPDGRIYYAEGPAVRQLGDSNWRGELEELASTSVAIDGGGDLYVGGANGTLYAIDRRGRVRWTYRASVRITTVPAVKNNGDVIFGCFDRNLYCVRGGDLRWRFATGGAIFSPPVVDRSGLIYFGSNDGHFYAVNDSGEQVWSLNLENEIHAAAAFDQQGRIYVTSLQRKVYCLSDR